MWQVQLSSLKSTITAKEHGARMASSVSAPVLAVRHAGLGAVASAPPAKAAADAAGDADGAGGRDATASPAPKEHRAAKAKAKGKSGKVGTPPAEAAEGLLPDVGPGRPSAVGTPVKDRR